MAFDRLGPTLVPTKAPRKCGIGSPITEEYFKKIINVHNHMFARERKGIHTLTNSP